MIERIIILSLLIGLPFFAVSQPRLDSLKSVWEDSLNADTVRLSALNSLIKVGYEFSQPDSAFYLAEIEYNFAKSKGLKNWMAKALTSQGISLSIRGLNSEAIKYFEKALSLYNELSDNKGIAKLLISLGTANLKKGNLIDAINHYNKSLVLAEKNGFKSELYKSLCNLGLVYDNLEEYDKALDYYQQSLSLIEKDKPEHKNMIMFNIGVIYSAQKKYKKAIEIYNKCLEFFDSVGDKVRLSKCLNNMGHSSTELGETVKAIRYYKRSLILSARTSNNEQKALSLLGLSEIYFDQGKIDSALTYAKRAMAISKKTGSLKYIQNAAHQNYLIYRNIGNDAMSLEMLELSIMAKDSLRKDDARIELTRQELKYEYEKKKLADDKQNEIETLENQRARWSIVLIFLFIILIVGLLFYNRQNRLQNERVLLLKEIDLLKEDQFSNIITQEENSDFKLNKEVLENHIKAKLNPTDWKILNLVYEKPLISNRELAENISLSIQGVSSS